MAATIDGQMSQHDDLNLMGLQELDSHLSIFDPGRDSSTPGATSAIGYADSNSTNEQMSTTIIVDSPVELDPRKITESYFHHKTGQSKSSSRNIKITEHHSHVSASGNRSHLRPESARDSMTSSMTTDIEDGSSVLSSLSSKATSPTGFDASSRETTKAVSNGVKRPKYDVRPKVSIPTDLAPSEYARQCIAAAESSRLNPYSMHPEEHALLRKHLTHQQVTTYLNIRNGVLRLWTRNPLIGVMRDEAIGCAKDTRWFDIAAICHEWLVRRGYINYGCLEHQESSTTIKKKRAAKQKKKTIVVIGAGMSGLGCARQLESLLSQFEDRFREMGEEVPQVVVLEGRDRIGGRVYSRAFKSKPQYPTLAYGSRHTAEMGGMIITGFDRGNPLNIIVRGQLALPYHALKSDTTIYDSTGRPVDIKRDQLAEKLFNYILDRVSEYKFKIHTPTTVQGDKDLLDAGRDVTGEGSKTIKEMEDTTGSSSPNTGSDQPQASEVQMVPVSSDRLTGRAHLEPGIPAVHTAAYKAREIGWLLKPGIGIESDLDLEPAVNSKHATLGSVFDEAIRQYMRIVDFTPLDLRLINWHVANLEYSNATTCSKLSLGGWDLDAGNEWEGKHTMVTGGYQQVPRGLLNCPQPLNVRRTFNVTKIAYSPDHSSTSRIESDSGEIFDADYIVSTIPLGVLKRQEIQFEPPLPDWKAGAIQRVGFGVLNKVVLVFKEAFWDQSRDIFGTLNNAPDRLSLNQEDYFSRRGRFFQWFNCSNTTGLPTLLALMAGDAAFQTENATNESIVTDATAVLRTVFGRAAVPAPTEAVVTRWGKDQFARGSYSYTGPNFRPDDYEVMAQPVGNLFFAGEHTCGTHPATVHGAYISGLRAASEVLETLIGPIKITEPLLLPKDSASSKRKSDALQSPLDPRQARLAAYETEVWTAIYAKFGYPPWKPENKQPNPYRLYSKDKWEEAKKKCEEGRRPGKGKPIPNEVKKMVTKMWKEATEEQKKPFNEEADKLKKAYLADVEEYKVIIAKWDKDTLAFRAQYELEHPSVPGPDEGLDSPSRRQRRAKRVSGYAEDSDSEMEM
ncbi:Lysine-specific histone demethylase 1A [Lachnellula suecica]|uniref:Lysine-specific histone demethylase 1A n=1 Tax=Lachnellula suecica TaxID=602035 RepID=A0A8T9BZR1_9HELO|nr:Lysine-specific histone demethylase 1A [Lachnellula suecica]